MCVQHVLELVSHSQCACTVPESILNPLFIWSLIYLLVHPLRLLLMYTGGSHIYTTAAAKLFQVKHRTLRDSICRFQKHHQKMEWWTNCSSKCPQQPWSLINRSWNPPRYSSPPWRSPENFRIKEKDRRKGFSVKRLSNGVMLLIIILTTHQQTLLLWHRQ